jgi:uncharacterized membrane protein YcjF (UPF0283 family)
VGEAVVRLTVLMVAVVLVIIAFVIQLEQYVVWGHWWDWSQWLHHESFSSGLVCVAIGMVVADHMISSRRRGTR